MGARSLPILGAVLVAAAGCALGPPSTPTTPPPTATTGASTAPSPHASSSAAASCRLPVASADAPTDGNPAHGTAGHGGFLQLPGGTFSPDPQSLGTYDLGLRKWLPVPRAWVSPDGTRYAWPEYRSASGPATGIIHVTEVASGADHTLTVPAPSMPVSFEPAGIYIVGVIPNSDAPSHGLALLDPASGALHQVIADGSWRAIAGGSAYGVDTDPAAAPPAQGGPGAGNRLRSVDLASGTVRNVQTFAGADVTVLGADGGTPVLLVQTADHAQVRSLTATLYDQPSTQPPPAPPLVADGDTLWLGGSGAVWRSQGGRPFARIAVPLQFASAAGACR